MALVTIKFNLDISPGIAPPVIPVSEYDINRQVQITLMNNGTPFNIPSNTTITIEGTLNGLGFRANATYTNNVVTFTLTEAMTASSGRAWVKVKLVNNSQPIQSCAFILEVDRAGVEASTVLGGTGFDQQLKDGVYDYLDDHQLASIAFLPHDLLPSGSLNDCTAPGYWLLSGGNTYTDCPLPSGHAGLLCVYPPVASIITQVLYDLTASKVSWQRSSRSGSFSGRNWTQITGMPALLVQPDNTYTSCDSVNESCILYLIENSSVAPWFSDFPFSGSGLLITVKAFEGISTRTQTAVSFRTNSVKRRICSVNGVWEEWMDEDAELAEAFKYEKDAVQIYTNFEFIEGKVFYGGTLIDKPENVTLQATKKVPCLGNTDYYNRFPNYVYNGATVVFYDKMGRIIGYKGQSEFTEYTYTTPDGTQQYSGTYLKILKFTTPSNARFFAFNWNVSENARKLFCVSNVPIFLVGFSQPNIRIKADSNLLTKKDKTLCVIGSSGVMADRLYRSAAGDYISGFQEHLRPYYKDIVSYGYSSCTYAVGGNSNPSIYEYITQGVNGLQAKNFTNIDEVLFIQSGSALSQLQIGEAGSLDIETIDTSTMIGAIRGIVQYILQQNPKCKIYLASFYKYDTSIANEYKIHRIHNETKKLCNVLGLTYIDLWSNVPFNYSNYTSENLIYTYDGGHANSLGNKALADVIKSSLLEESGTGALDSYQPSNLNSYGKKYVAFGASLDWGSVWSPTPDKNLHRVKEEWRIPTRIAIATGMENNFANEGVGGMGFFVEVNGKTVLSKVQNYDFSDVALVTITGSKNDRYTVPLGTADDDEDARTTCGAIRKCIKTIAAKNPSTQIVIMQPLPGGVDGSVDDVWNSAPPGAKWSVMQYDREVSKLCRDEHVGYVNWVESSLCRNWKYVGYNGSNTPNYTHPTDDEAYLLLGEFIAGKIRALQQDLHEDYPEELYEKFVPEITDGKYIHKEDGTERSGTEVASATPYLYVRGGTKIHIDHIFCQLNASISVYTIQHTFISAIAHDITEDSITFTVPENAACIRITSPIGIRPIVYVERERNNALIFAQDRISLGTLTENSFISKIDGTVRTDTTRYSSTDYISVQSGYYQVINPMLRMQAGICAYDSQQNFIACLLSDNMTYGQFYVDSSVSYIRCSVLSNYSYAFWVEKIPKNAYEEQTTYSDSWQKATDGRVDSPFARISSLEPTITIIDDDTTNIEYVERYHDICEEMGVKGNYAVITSRLETVTGLKEKLLQYEDEGYGMLYHVYTQTGATYFQPGSNRDIALAEANYCKGVRQMREFGFTNYNYWISPYGVNDEDMQDLCKRHGAQCLISTYNNTFIRPNGTTGKGVAERYNIPRCSLGHNAERYPYFTIEMLKDQITQCASAHGWLIITTHVNEWGSSLDGDNRLKEVIQHALDNGCVFKTFAEAFEDRRALFTLNEIL